MTALCLCRGAAAADARLRRRRGAVRLGTAGAGACVRAVRLPLAWIASASAAADGDILLADRNGGAALLAPPTRRAARRAAAAGADGDGGGSTRVPRSSRYLRSGRSRWRRAAARRAAPPFCCGSGSGLSDCGRRRRAHRQRSRRDVVASIDGSTHVPCLAARADRCLAAATGTGAGSAAVLLWSLARGRCRRCARRVASAASAPCMASWSAAAPTEQSRCGTWRRRKSSALRTTVPPRACRRAVGASHVPAGARSGGLIASLSATITTVHIWDRGPQQLARTIGGGGGGFGRGAASGGSAVTCLAATHDTLLVGGADGGVLAWDVRTAGGSPLVAIPGGGGGGGGRSPAHRRRALAAAAADGTVSVWRPFARDGGRAVHRTALRRRRRRLPRRRRAARRCCCLEGAPTARWRRGASARCAAAAGGGTERWAWDLDVGYR